MDVVRSTGDGTASASGAGQGGGILIQANLLIERRENQGKRQDVMCVYFYYFAYQPRYLKLSPFSDQSHPLLTSASTMETIQATEPLFPSAASDRQRRRCGKGISEP